jgi:hypothetical protein
MTPRERAVALIKQWSYGGADDENDITRVIEAAVEEEREACASLAAKLTTGPDASIYPGIALKSMDDSTRMIAYTTAQKIATAIFDRSKET